MRGGSIQLAKVFGIRVGVSPSWFFVLFLMIYLLTGQFRDVLDGSDSEAFATAVAGALLFFASVTLHELGHAVVARRHGIGISGIDLWFFGGLARMDRDTRTPGEELKVAAAGPAVTLLIVGVCVGAGALAASTGDFYDAATLSTNHTSPALALTGWLALINAFLFVFNMVPAYPLDGGRIARALAWRATGDKTRGTRFSARLGQGFAYIVIGLGLFIAATGRDAFSGVMWMILGWFLLQAARGAIVSSDFHERIEGVTAEDLMDRQPVSIPGATTTLAAQDEFFLRYRWPWFPVVDDGGRFLGILRSERVDGAVQAGQPALAVAEVLDGDAATAFRVPAQTPLEALLGSEPLRTLGALMVVDGDGRLCGVVTIEQVRRALAAAVPGRVS
jgi:Zn-dependent protease